MQAVAEVGVVVGDEDTGRLHSYDAPWTPGSTTSPACGLGASGKMASTRVPPFGKVSTLQEPPSSSARSRIEESPTPAERSSEIPRPSSVTSRRRMFASS